MVEKQNLEEVVEKNEEEDLGDSSSIETARGWRRKREEEKEGDLKSWGGRTELV